MHQFIKSENLSHSREASNNWSGFCSVDFTLLLCSQAWDPTESPGQHTSSSSTTSSASLWAGWPPGAGGGDPGLRRWGAGGSRRLLQRSGRHTKAQFIRPCSLLPLCASVLHSSTVTVLFQTDFSSSLFLLVLSPPLSFLPSSCHLQQSGCSHYYSTSVSRLSASCQTGATAQFSSSGQESRRTDTFLKKKNPFRGK